MSTAGQCLGYQLLHNILTSSYHSYMAVTKNTVKVTRVTAIRDIDDNKTVTKVKVTRVTAIRDIDDNKTVTKVKVTRVTAIRDVDDVGEKWRTGRVNARKMPSQLVYEQSLCQPHVTLETVNWNH